MSNKPFILYNLNDPLLNACIEGTLCAEGTFRGVVESTYRKFIETNFTSDDLVDVKAYANILGSDGQECLLYVDNHSNAFLMSCMTFNITYQGEFKQVQYDNFDTSKDHTRFFGNPDSYYYIRQYK